MHILKLLLLTSKHDEAVLRVRFILLARLHNLLVKYARNLVRDKIRRNKWYQKQLRAYVKAKKRLEEVEKYLSDENTDKRVLKALQKEHTELKATIKTLAETMNEYRERIGLTKGGLEQYCKKFQKMYSQHISSQIAQKEATFVWSAVEKVLFSEGKELHFKRWDAFRVISCKSAKNGICFYNKRANVDNTRSTYTPLHEIGVEYLGLDMEIKMDWNDKYQVESIRDKVKFCTILREMFSDGYRYYVILTLEGEAPKRYTMGSGIAGCDPGVSTFAYYSDNTIAFEELSPKVKEYNKEIAKLQKKIDRSLRAMNPEFYNEDGTIKKGKHKWKYSRNCLRLKRRLKSLYRKKSAYIKCEHNNRANRVIQDASVFITEDMNYKALAKKSTKQAERSDKETVITQKDGTEKTVQKFNKMGFAHRFKKKKRFGKSMNDRAPALQLSIIQKKMAQYGGLYYEVNTKEYKASQYNHSNNKYIKVPLSQREKKVGRYIVQRDMYSSFLLKHADINKNKPDRDACRKDFKTFVNMQNKCIAYLKETGFSMPACIRL